MSKWEFAQPWRERVHVDYECYEGDIAVNLTLAGLDELPAGDEVDLDTLEELWLPPGRVPSFMVGRR